MQFNATMSASEKMQTQLQVDSFNKSINTNGRTPSQQLGKDDFLKILIAQLGNQDPTKPMENTEFIAQMAQFSSLEQMTNMSNEFTKMATLLNTSEAVTAIGKNVDIEVGDRVIHGSVEAAVRGVQPQVQVNGMLYNMEQIKRIYN